jgi:hypothetical protein
MTYAKSQILHVFLTMQNDGFPEFLKTQIFLHIFMKKIYIFHRHVARRDDATI